LREKQGAACWTMCFGGRGSHTAWHPLLCQPAGAGGGRSPLMMRCTRCEPSGSRHSRYSSSATTLRSAARPASGSSAAARCTSSMPLRCATRSNTWGGQGGGEQSCECLGCWDASGLGTAPGRCVKRSTGNQKAITGNQRAQRGPGMQQGAGAAARALRRLAARAYLPRLAGRLLRRPQHVDVAVVAALVLQAQVALKAHQRLARGGVEGLEGRQVPACVCRRGGGRGSALGGGCVWRTLKALRGEHWSHFCVDEGPTGGAGRCIEDTACARSDYNKGAQVGRGRGLGTAPAAAAGEIARPGCLSAAAHLPISW
jgi:hypothetical protein